MATPLTRQPAADDAQYQMLAQQYLDEMERLREQMQHSRREMEQARRVAGSLLAQIKALFPESIGHW